MLVYTAYDGDLTPKIDEFIAFALLHQAIPMNPTKLLGYYLSTIAHDNQKKEAMLDCISIALSADEFWIFIEDEDKLLLAEGVQMELMYWMKYKGGPVRVFPIKVLQQTIYQKTALELDRYLLTEDAVVDLKNINKITLAGDELIAQNDLRPLIYIDIAQKHHKYIDWVKLYAFKNQWVPVDLKSVLTNFMMANFDRNWGTIEEEVKTRITNQVQITSINSEAGTWSLKEMGVPKYSTTHWVLHTKN